MPSPFDQAKGYGYWVSGMEIITELIWRQQIFDVVFLRINLAFGIVFPLLRQRVITISGFATYEMGKLRQFV
jgi:hypothetical protein